MSHRLRHAFDEHDAIAFSFLRLDHLGRRVCRNEPCRCLVSALVANQSNHQSNQSNQSNQSIQSIHSSIQSNHQSNHQSNRIESGLLTPMCGENKEKGDEPVSLSTSPEPIRINVVWNAVVRKVGRCSESSESKVEAQRWSFEVALLELINLFL